MRALILSDIHSNIDALDAVLEAAPAYDVVWNLGDVVGYGGSPNEVVERVRALGNFFVRGNHDRACAGSLDAQSFNPIALFAVHWTQKELTRDNMDWLRAMPRGPLLPEASRVTCVHGSPLDEDQYLLSVSDACQQWEHTTTQITFFGHTHVQGGFSMHAEGDGSHLAPIYSNHDKVDLYEMNLRQDATKYLINPGSVGQPRDRDWRAAFALYDDVAHRITFGRVPYPVHAAQIRIQRAGLPERLATRLRSGR